MAETLDFRNVEFSESVMVPAVMAYFTVDVRDKEGHTLANITIKDRRMAKRLSEVLASEWEEVKAFRIEGTAVGFVHQAVVSDEHEDMNKEAADEEAREIFEKGRKAVAEIIASASVGENEAE